MASDEIFRLRATLLRPVMPTAEHAPGSLLRYDLTTRRRVDPVYHQAPVPRARRWSPWLSAALLYLGAVFLLLLDLGGRPAAAYNWEVYSARGIWEFLAAPTLAHFAPTDGLMTDSGHSPLVVLPVVLSWRLAGASLLSLRLPIALLAALAVPLCWLVGRRLVGNWPAAIGALLLAISPAFLVYGRTATNVGLSLVPALLTLWLLARALEQPTAPRVAFLQLALIGDGWVYAPIRFLWLIAVAAFVCEFVWRRGLRRHFASAALVTAFVLPLFLYGVATWTARVAGDMNPPQPVAVLRAYYNGRGEQVFVGDAGLSNLAAITPVVTHNAGDLLALLLDRDTRPALLDYWNPHGRLEPVLLVPFVVLGLGRVLLRARHAPGARLFLLALAGFTLPILLTSNVHIGRLIYALPLLSLAAARGIVTVSEGLAWLPARWGGVALGRWHRPGTWWRANGWSAILAALVLLAVAFGGWREYTAEIPLESMVRGEGLLRARAPELVADKRTAVIFTNLASQGLVPEDPAMEIYPLVSYRLGLDRLYRFVDLNHDPLPTSSDPRALALLGGDPAAVLDRAGLCTAVYYAPEDVLPALNARTAALGCARPPEVVLLPR